MYCSRFIPKFDKENKLNFWYSSLERVCLKWNKMAERERGTLLYIPFIPK